MNLLPKDKESLLSSANEYILWEKNQENQKKMKDLITKVTEQNDEKIWNELDKRMNYRLKFGTAGIRGKMDFGYSFMNDIIIIQTSQGLCNYVIDTIPDCKSKGIVIGYDGRHNSLRFAQLTAQVFLSRKFTVYFFNHMVGTPLVPFGIKYKNTAVGVMITASHNPKADNGYKVYWDNGAQIISPHSDNIATSISNNLEPWQSQYDWNLEKNNVIDCTIEFEDAYFNQIKQYCYYYEQNKSSTINVAYTAMHGVGAPFVERALKVFNLPPYIPVIQQVQPDPDFSTVAFPNPEEGKGALSLAIETADKNNCTLILANDPDADRLAIAEKVDNQWKIFTGNEIANLLSYYCFQQWKKNNPKKSTQKICMIASTVSSKFIQSMANKENFIFVDTLTGFKWMGNKAAEMIEKGFEFLFAYEVEIGFLIGDISLDKDGIRTAAVIVELANQLAKQGISLSKHLEYLSSEYGYFAMNNSYYFSYNNEQIDKLFHDLRFGGTDGSYRKQMGEYKILHIRDITTGYDSRQPENKSILPITPKDNMITFYFENNSVATLRTSGTEPKMKYYFECNDKTSKENARSLVDSMTKALIQYFIQPEKYNFIPPKRD